MRKTIQRVTPKFIHLNRLFKNNPFTLLDVGAGNHSASKTKRLFPKCEYYGIDIDKNYNNDDSDFKAMAAFYEMDLTKLDFSTIPDQYFDFIRMAHVIEHLKNGDKVIEGLVSKLKPNGYFYIEYPGEKSKTLPSMYGTLNFYDDDTHVRVYSIKEIEDIFIKENCTIISSGTRRNILFLLSMPFRIVGNLIQGKKITGNIFWDLLGFAEFVLAKKNQISLSQS